MSPSTDHATDTSLLDNHAHILVATDLTDQELLIPHILKQAKVMGQQAKAPGALVTLVHAIKPGNCRLLAGCPGCGIVEEAKIKARAGLEKMVSALEAEGVRCTYVLKLGYAMDVVMDQIRISGPTRLLVTGVSGNSAMWPLREGFASRVMAQATCAVLVVPNDTSAVMPDIPLHAQSSLVVIQSVRLA